MRHSAATMLACCLVASLASPCIASPEKAAAESFKDALAEGHYPWYDNVHDQLKPVDLKVESKSNEESTFLTWIAWILSVIGDFVSYLFSFSGLGGRMSGGNNIPIVLTIVGVILLLIMIRVLWRYSGPALNVTQTKSVAVGRAGRITALPEELGTGGIKDPWTECLERRRKGDYSGAIVYMFAYQLLELDRRGLIRLRPGLTGRNYVQIISDSRLREPLSASLRLFEQARYGHKAIPEAKFNTVWTEFEAFQERLALLPGHPA